MLNPGFWNSRFVLSHCVTSGHPNKKIADGICELGTKTEKVGKEHLLESRDSLISQEFLLTQYTTAKGVLKNRREPKIKILYPFI